VDQLRLLDRQRILGPEPPSPCRPNSLSEHRELPRASARLRFQTRQHRCQARFFNTLLDPGRAAHASPSRRAQYCRTVIQAGRPPPRTNFEAQSHGHFARCLRFVGWVRHRTATQDSLPACWLGVDRVAAATWISTAGFRSHWHAHFLPRQALPDAINLLFSAFPNSMYNDSLTVALEAQP
jgi:hypothetical protein